MSRRGNYLRVWLGVVVGVLVAAGGCGRPRGELFPALEEALVWPEAPEPARIQYVGSLAGQMDLHKEVTWLESLGELFAGQDKTGVLLAPYAVAVDGEVLYVSDVSGGVVHVFHLDNRRYEQFAALSESERLMRPVGLALVHEDIFVVDALRQEVCVFDTKGQFVFAFGQGRLQRPSGIVYDAGGERVFVADTARHVIDVFDAEGAFLETWGQRGAAAGQFNFPTHLCADAQGQLYVSDTLNYRIQVFGPDGMWVRQFGIQGDRPGNFAHPCGVAADTFGHIYVTDRQFENVQVFDQQGQILMAWGQEGGDPGEFWLPGGITIDNRNRIYVADSFNKRIQVFELLEGSEP